jgi:hypothetical protein
MAPTLANMQQMLTIIQKAATTSVMTPAYQPMMSNTMLYQQMSPLARPIAPSSSTLPQLPLAKPLMLVHQPIVCP